jgi:hypothetical protein
VSPVETYPKESAPQRKRKVDKKGHKLPLSDITNMILNNIRGAKNTF